MRDEPRPSAASGRKPTLKSGYIRLRERPLLGRADNEPSLMSAWRPEADVERSLALRDACDPKPTLCSQGNGCIRFAVLFPVPITTEPQAIMSDYIDPERDQFDAFKELPRDQPIMMLNFLCFREKAVYEDDREATGAEAYAAYGRESSLIFRRVGGEIIWRGKPELMVIGPGDKRWDMIFVARYPTASAFLEMVTDPDYRIAVKHRQAAVQDSRLICTTATTESDDFSG